MRILTYGAKTDGPIHKPAMDKGSSWKSRAATRIPSRRLPSGFYGEISADA